MKQSIFLALSLMTLSSLALAQEPAASAANYLDASTPSPHYLSALEIRDQWRNVVDEMAATGLESSAIRLEESVAKLSDEEVLKIYGNADFEALIGVFRTTGVALDAVDDADVLGGKTIRELLANSDRTLNSTQSSSEPVYDLTSTGFPTATGYPGGICPSSPNRTNADSLIQAVHDIGDARLLLNIAQGVWSPLSRACDEIIVVLGEGFNTSLACIPVDIALFAAELVVGESETTVEHAQYCNETVNSAEIEGTYDRVGHLHTDLVDHDIAISNQLTDHDIHISTQLAQHDADIKALLGILQQTVEENQRLIKISMSRQLEVMKLLITAEGLRVIDPQVLTCTGDDCPQVIACPTGEFSWNKCEK